MGLTLCSRSNPSYECVRVRVDCRNAIRSRMGSCATVELDRRMTANEDLRRVNLRTSSGKVKRRLPAKPFYLPPRQLPCWFPRGVCHDATGTGHSGSTRPIRRLMQHRHPGLFGSQRGAINGHPCPVVRALALLPLTHRTHGPTCKWRTRRLRGCHKRTLGSTYDVRLPGRPNHTSA